MKNTMKDTIENKLFELNYEEEQSVLKEKTETQNMDCVLLSDDVMEQINGGVKAPDFLALK